ASWTCSPPAYRCFSRAVSSESGRLVFGRCGLLVFITTLRRLLQPKRCYGGSGTPAVFAGLRGSSTMARSEPPDRSIIGFHQDEQGHWVADLQCGHTQHVRHDPPWQNRPWVVTPEGRAAFLG